MEPQVNTIILPRLVANAAVAEALFEGSVLDVKAGDTVTVHARAVAAVSESFMRRLMNLISDAGFSRVVMKGAPPSATSLIEEKTEAAGLVLILNRQGTEV